MSGVNMFPVMQNLMASAVKRQVVKDVDYYDKEGLLVCGVCGQHRQAMRDFPNPTDEDPERTSPIKVVVDCRCDLEREAKEQEEKRRRETYDAVQKYRSLSLMDEKAKAATFDQFVMNQHNEKNLRLAKRYVTGFDEMIEKNQGLLFWGDVGTSKSFLAACIANYLLDRGRSVIMTSFVKILSEIDSSRTAEMELQKMFNNVDLLIFDDLGAERSSSFSLEKVYNFVDNRYRRNKPMIVTTNFSLQAMIEEEDINYKRIFDRIFEACYPMQFTGPSWRVAKASKRFEEMQALMEKSEG